MTRRRLPGEIVDLEPLSRAHISERYAAWFNDPEVTRFNSHGSRVMTLADVEAYVARVEDSESEAVFAMIAKDKGVHVGNITLQKIDAANKSAEYAIILGDKEYWGRGIAAEASKLLIEFGFKDLGLHRIWCGTSVANIPMQKLAERSGFTKEGVRREAMLKNGEFVDVIEYGVLARDLPHELLQ